MGVSELAREEDRGPSRRRLPKTAARVAFDLIDGDNKVVASSEYLDDLCTARRRYPEYEGYRIAQRRVRVARCPTQ